MSKWQYESDITPSTITITDLVNQDWVMRITPDRRIEVNEDVEVTDAARKVLDVLQVLMDQQRQNPNLFGWYDNHDIYNERQTEDSIPLYTHPVQPISDEAITIIAETYADLGGDIGADKWNEFARAIEQAHGIGVKDDTLEG